VSSGAVVPISSSADNLCKYVH